MREGRLGLIVEMEGWIESSQNERQVHGTRRKCHMELNLRELAHLNCKEYRARIASED